MYNQAIALNISNTNPIMIYFSLISGKTLQMAVPDQSLLLTVSIAFENKRISKLQVRASREAAGVY
jgi:hypothetical protein